MNRKIRLKGEDGETFLEVIIKHDGAKLEFTIINKEHSLSTELKGWRAAWLIDFLNNNVVPCQIEENESCNMEFCKFAYYSLLAHRYKEEWVKSIEKEIEKAKKIFSKVSEE